MWGSFTARPMPIHALTGLRFVAALMVFLFHASPQHFCEGFAGVAFFYVLSGFILTHNYRRNLRNLRWQEVRNFYACRLARIYPVHVLTFIAIIPLMWPHLRANLVTHLWR